MSETNHDGFLGEPFCLKVHYDDVPLTDDFWSDNVTNGVRISGIHGYTPLTPRQALLLLAWLYAEKDTLEQLAKEQMKEVR